MDSRPPATATGTPSWVMLRAASAIACSPEEQKRLTVCAAAVTGRPARMAHWRAMLPPVAPSGLALPMVTSSTWPGSMPARFTAWAMTWPPMSAPWVSLKAPRTALPLGGRAVETMTASTMGAVLLLRLLRRSFGGGFGGSLLGLLPLLRDQLLLRQLADGGPGQRVAEFEMRRLLVPPNLVGQESAQLIERE